MALLQGNSAKDSKYLKRIKDAIEHDDAHPRNKGIKMQAHHIISGEGMRASGLGKKIQKFGYDINLLPNLSFIPCTLQGACYLGVQPHRGNHDSRIDQDNYVDDREPLSYHEMVAVAIQSLDLPMSKTCPGDNASKQQKIIEELDRLSKKILNLIQMKPAEAPLTKIALSFGKNGSGCSGTDSVVTHRKDRPCPVGRHHLHDPTQPAKSQGSEQNAERITYVVSEKFRLKVGR